MKDDDLTTKQDIGMSKLCENTMLKKELFMKRYDNFYVILDDKPITSFLVPEIGPHYRALQYENRETSLKRIPVNKINELEKSSFEEFSKVYDIPLYWVKNTMKRFISRCLD